MSDRSRRGFLRYLLASSGLVMLPGCDTRLPHPDPVGRGSGPVLEPDWGLLRAVAQDVLPTELGDGGVEEVVRRFKQWLEDYQPAVERDHGYLTSEVSYTPEDPTSRWATQLRELDQSGSSRYSESSAAERERRLRAAAVAAEAEERSRLRSSSQGGPPEPGPSGSVLSTADALRAPHVTLALLGFFFSSPEAADLCFRARIRPLTCRDLSDASVRPG